MLLVLWKLASAWSIEGSGHSRHHRTCCILLKLSDSEQQYWGNNGQRRKPPPKNVIRTVQLFWLFLPSLYFDVNGWEWICVTSVLTKRDNKCFTLTAAHKRIHWWGHNSFVYPCKEEGYKSDTADGEEGMIPQWRKERDLQKYINKTKQH